MGEPWPRVTEILAAVGLAPDFSGIPPAVLEAARARGSAVHAAIEARHHGYAYTLTPEQQPYLDAYVRFEEETKHQPLVSEIEVAHPEWMYVGHPDRVGWLNGRRCILDWKTPESLDLKPVSYQLAAYRCAWNRQHPQELVDMTAAVQLKRDGTYRLHPIDAVAVEHVFLAAATVFHARSIR